MCLNRPIIFMAGMAYKIDWAHLISWQLLPIRMNRPIIFMADAVNKIEWAHLFL